MKISIIVTANLVSLLYLPLILTAADRKDDGTRLVGVAKVDITPAHPVRLSGYGNRREEFEEVSQPIWAKALAFGPDGAADEEGAALLITVDNCGIPAAMHTELAERLQEKVGLKAERLAICFSHTHTAPCLKGALVNIFSSDIPPKHQSNIDRYSRQLIDQLEEVALAALAGLRPAQLSMAVGSAGFARNRRVLWGGPVDHSLPVLFLHSPEGELRAVFANYACHATTLSYNKVSWRLAAPPPIPAPISIHGISHSPPVNIVTNKCNTWLGVRLLNGITSSQ